MMDRYDARQRLRTGRLRDLILHRSTMNTQMVAATHELGNLVLFRKPGEEIVIDGGIRIKVLESASSGARLLITAPRKIRVKRGEEPLKLAAIITENRLSVPGSCVLEVEQSGSQRVA